MCFTSNAIEQQAYRFTEKIHNSSLYKIVRLELVGKYVDFDSEIPLDAQLNPGEHLPLIKNVILVDNFGKQYKIEPNKFGLKFASGELTYKQYVYSRKTEARKLLIYTLGSAGIFFLTAGSFIHYFL
ncbi:hypothetical protein V7654_03875 [Bacillus sp. JJ1609]|uniref:hypothetical protein n=1 Tax=Bacillus sp. JJ1609 TaxID=3122977 RepID=UPI002FFFF2DE